LPFSHLAGGTPKDTKNLLIEKFGFSGDAFCNRNSRISQDMLAMQGNNQPMNGFIHTRSRAGSSFDLNDCFSKDHPIEDIMAGGSISRLVMPGAIQSMSYTPSLFKKQH